MDPVVVRVGRIRDEVEGLGELHRVGAIVDEEVTTDGDKYAVRLNSRGRLTVYCDDMVLDFSEGEALRGWLEGFLQRLKEGWIGNLRLACQRWA